MNYPSLTEVENASLNELSKWRRFLPYPGLMHVGTGKFWREYQNESAIMERICGRIQEITGLASRFMEEVGI